MYEQYQVCTHCVNRRVSIQTASGSTHEGVIVGVDYQNVYLDTSSAVATAAVSSKKLKYKGKISSKVSGKAKIKSNDKAQTSAFFGLGAGGAILTLALFDLLAIALLV